MKNVHNQGKRREQRGPFESICSELTMVLHREGRIALKTRREIGEKMQRDRRLLARKFIRELHEAGFKLWHLRNLQRKHLVWWARYCESQNYAASTIVNYEAILVWLFTVIKKPDLVSDMEAYYADPSCRIRSSAATQDKSERGAGVEFATLYERALEVDARVACVLKLQRLLGLRVRESWLIRPHLAVQDGVVTICNGTKGGRPRVLSQRITDEQQAAVDVAKSFALTSSESLVPRGWALTRWKDHYYYVCTTIGMTRRDLGVTSHSFRHGYSHEKYEQHAKVLPPVCNPEGPRADVHVDRAARDLVAQDAGHSRRRASSAYLGSSRSIRNTSATKSNDSQC
jgi:hypothetical protein